MSCQEACMRLLMSKMDKKNCPSSDDHIFEVVTIIIRTFWLQIVEQLYRKYTHAQFSGHN
jgi:hypothetical protein